MPSKLKKPSEKTNRQYIVQIDSQLRTLILGYRQSLGWTQVYMAQRLNIPQQSYARFELAPEKARVSRLLSVLRIMGVDITLSWKDTSQEPGEEGW